MPYHPGQRSGFHDTGDIALLPGEARAAPWSLSALQLVDFPAHDIPDPATNNFVLCLIRRGEANTAFGFGNRRWHGRLLPGMFAPVTPPNVVGDISLGAPQQHLVLSFSALTVDTILGTNGGDLGIVHETGFRDPLLAQICLSIWEAADERKPKNRLFEEYALACLVAGLAIRSASLRPAKYSPRPLSQADWSLIETYISDQLDTELSLPHLAGVLGMTQHAFLRAFKARAGCAPHQYVLRRRIEYVRQLLLDRKLSLADIALQAGFADQAHMTATFARMTGTTPGNFGRNSNIAFWRN